MKIVNVDTIPSVDGTRIRLNWDTDRHHEISIDKDMDTQQVIASLTRLTEDIKRDRLEYMPTGMRIVDEENLIYLEGKRCCKESGHIGYPSIVMSPAISHLFVNGWCDEYNKHHGTCHTIISIPKS